MGKREREREREREKPRKTVNYREQTEGYQREEVDMGWRKQGKGIKEYTYHDEKKIKIKKRMFIVQCYFIWIASRDRNLWMPCINRFFSLIQSTLIKGLPCANIVR